MIVQDSYSPRGQSTTLLELIFRASHLLRSRLNAQLAGYGLNDVRYGVLTALQGMDAVGCSQNELAQRLQQSESNISTLIERMRQDGLIERLQTAQDRRKRLLLISEHGRRLLDRIHASHQHSVGTLLNGLSEPQQEWLADLLQVLIDSLACDQDGNTSADPSVPRPHLLDREGSRPASISIALEGRDAG